MVFMKLLMAFLTHSLVLGYLSLCLNHVVKSGSACGWQMLIREHHSIRRHCCAEGQVSGMECEGKQRLVPGGRTSVP